MPLQWTYAGNLRSHYIEKWRKYKLFVALTLIFIRSAHDIPIISDIFGMIHPQNDISSIPVPYPLPHLSENFEKEECMGKVDLENRAISGKYKPEPLFSSPQ